MYILSQSYNNTENKNIYNANVNSWSQRFSVAYPTTPTTAVAASLMPNPLIYNLASSRFSHKYIMKTTEKN